MSSSTRGYRFLFKQLTFQKNFNLTTRNYITKAKLSSSNTSRIYCLSSYRNLSIETNNYYGRKGAHRYLSSSSSSSSQNQSFPSPYIDPKYSYVFGRSNESFVYSTIDKQFKKQLSLNPDEIIFGSYAENKEITFKEFDHDVNKLTKALVKKFNISKGDFVGVFAYNCYNWLKIQFACSRIGAILTPINPSYKANELAYILKKGKVKCLFMPGPKSCHSELNNHLDVLQSEKVRSIQGELCLENIILMDSENEYSFDRRNDNDDLPNFVNDNNNIINFKLKNCHIFNWQATETDGIIYGTLNEAKELGANESDLQELCIIDPDSVSPDDLFAVYYTSGTTGLPKGACVSQFTVINNVKFCQNRIRGGRPKSWRANSVTTLPMFHIFAGVLNTLSPTLSNTRIIYSSYKYDISAMVNAMIKYEANVVSLTPTILIDMLAYIDKNKFENFPLQIVQSGGAALSPEVISRAFKILPNLEDLKTGYGSTENGAVATMQTINEPNETKAHTSGPPLDFTEIRIVEPNSEKLVPLGKRGEIQTRGYNTMIEYLNDPEKTREVITNKRWYRTGDMGFLHPHGSLEISGRIKHLIIKGGENIYPEEVEQLIHTLNYVEDVHVVGVPDKRFGEQVCAWVKLKPDFKETTTTTKSKEGGDSKEVHRDDIIKFCKENITYFKVPKYILFVQEFPMTPTKKVQHHIMTKQSIEILKLQDQV